MTGYRKFGVMALLIIETTVLGILDKMSGGEIAAVLGPSVVAFLGANWANHKADTEVEK